MAVSHSGPIILNCLSLYQCVNLITNVCHSLIILNFVIRLAHLYYSLITKLNCLDLFV